MRNPDKHGFAATTNAASMASLVTTGIQCDNWKRTEKIQMQMQEESVSQEDVNALVSAVIARYGFEAALPWLLGTVAEMAAAALTKPTDAGKARQFAFWSRAVQAALSRDGALPRTFEQRLASIDAIHARGMGICLD
jgi:hypothetical protein